MEISQSVFVCVSDLAFKFAEQLAEDLELFAHHAGRKSVNMNDVIISAHRNKHLADSLRLFSCNLKAKEPQSEKKRKKSSHKEDRAPPLLLMKGMGQDNHLSSSCSKLSIRVSILLPSPRNSREARDVHLTY